MNHKSIAFVFSAIGLLGLLFCSQGSALAQNAVSRTARETWVENIQLRERERYLAKTPKEEAVLVKADRFLISIGGWADIDYVEFGNDDNNREEKDILDCEVLVDARLWVNGVWRMKLGEREYEHAVFAQFRNLDIFRWPDQDLVRERDEGAHIDLLYSDVDLGIAKVRPGRQYLNLGRGIALSDIYDGFRLFGDILSLSYQAFAVRTLPRTENIDYSVPGYDKKTKRYFIGGETVWRPKPELGLYGFFLVQHDSSKPYPDSGGQDYAYHSQYWGLGSEYNFTQGHSLWSEYIFETGSSAVYGEEKRNDVIAHAVDFGALYQFQRLTHPNLMIEYSLGSGDSDRINVTNTEDGNIEGTDRNFLPFGFFPSGYALAPALSNIQILRMGSSIKPLEKFWAFRRLEIRADGYFYWKVASKGGIYDIDATEPSYDIGREIDFTLQWPVLSDIFAAVRYGLFFPGKAYPAASNDPESYLATSLSFTF